jgi:hypothetical protein
MCVGGGTWHRRGSAPDLLLAGERELDPEVRMGDEPGDVDELIEQVEGQAALRGAPAPKHRAVGIDANEPPFDRDGVDQDDGVRSDEPLELAAGRTEAAGLDLHDLVRASHVHHEAVHRGLDPRVGDGRGVAGLERRVERALAERREVRHGGTTP